MSCFISKIEAVKFAFKLRNRVKRWLFGPRFVGGRDTPNFRHAFSNRTYFRPRDRIWLSSVQRASRVADEKEEEEEERIRGKI